MSTFTDNLPQSADELAQRSKTDVQRELDNVAGANKPNVFLPAEWLGAIPTANANRIFDYILQLQLAIEMNMPDTALDEFADRWAAIWVGSRNAATGSTGNVAATGTATSTILITDSYQAGGVTYEVTAPATITAQSLTVASITQVGTLATVTTDDNHLLGSNVPVDIVGANESEFNGLAFEIQVTGLTTFTYTLPSDPGAPATGTITADFTAASVPVAAVPPSDPDAPFGLLSNQTLDTPLTLLSAVSGFDNVANVDFGELAGGTDEETDQDLKNRYIDKIRNPVSHFASPDIDQQIRATVPGVTRTFIQKSGQQVSVTSVTGITRDGVFATVTTGSPHGLFTGAEISILGAFQGQYNVVDAPILLLSTTTFAYEVSGSPVTPATGTITAGAVIPLGRVQTYFVRDNDTVIIPTAPEIADVKAAELTITPANTPDSFVIVSAPVALSQDFTFTELSPNTTTMQAAVTANLDQFFIEGVDVGTNIDEDAYRSAIFNTTDPETGQTVTSFELSSPTGDITVNSGELPLHGSDAYP